MFISQMIMESNKAYSRNVNKASESSHVVEWKKRWTYKSLKFKTQTRNNQNIKNLKASARQK